MAVLMSLVFAVATFFLCKARGSFALFWLIYAVSLADGIGTSLLLIEDCSSPVDVLLSCNHCSMQYSRHWSNADKTQCSNAITQAPVIYP